MQLDTEKNGLAAIFKEWQVPLIDELFEGELTSGEAHNTLKLLNVRTHPNSKNTVSRANIIGFLNKLVDQNLLTYTEYSGKGGWGRKYKMTLTEEEFAHKIIDLFFSKLIDIFPKESRTFPWVIP